MATISRNWPVGANQDLLAEELRAVFSEVSRSSADGIRIHNVTDDQATNDTIDAILAAHDGNALTAEQAQTQIRSNSKGQASGIPNYATWTEAEALSYIDANVTDLASAKAVLRGLARMVIALRNNTWPDLEGS